MGKCKGSKAIEMSEGNSGYGNGPAAKAAGIDFVIKKIQAMEGCESIDCNHACIRTVNYEDVESAVKIYYYTVEPNTFWGWRLDCKINTICECVRKSAFSIGREKKK